MKPLSAVRLSHCIRTKVACILVTGAACASLVLLAVADRAVLDGSPEFALIGAADTVKGRLVDAGDGTSSVGRLRITILAQITLQISVLCLCVYDSKDRSVQSRFSR